MTKSLQEILSRCLHCGEKGAKHYVPPTFDTRGFFICEKKDDKPLDLRR